MLTRLFKYEFKSTARFFLPTYAVLVVLTLLFKGSSLLSEQLNIMIVPQTLLFILYVIALIAMCVLTVGVLVYRFYKNMTGDEAYLTYTLPVSVWTQVAVKAVTAVIWTAASIIVALISIFISAYYKGLIDEIGDFFSLLFDVAQSQYAVNVAVSSVLLLLTCVACALVSYLMFYTAIAIGQLLRSHRLLGSIVAYVGLYILNQILAGSLLTTIMLNFTSLWSQLSNITASLLNLTAFWIFIIALNLIVAAIYYLVTCWLLRRKLNLE